MNEAGVQIRDYMGDFVANHVDLSEGKVALKVSAGEVEILGESLVKEVIGWAMEPKSSPLPEYGDYNADFPAGLSAARISTDQSGVRADLRSGPRTISSLATIGPGNDRLILIRLLI